MSALGRSNVRGYLVNGNGWLCTLYLYHDKQRSFDLFNVLHKGPPNYVSPM